MTRWPPTCAYTVTRPPVPSVAMARLGVGCPAMSTLTLEVANAELAGRPYLLIGVGRWGSSDPWLGIPVTWDQISGARVIIEAGFADFKVTPSQGTHFFQSLTTFHVGYFTVNPDAGEGFVDWDYLAGLPAVRETGAVRHLRLPRPLTVQMDGRRGEGLITKPPAAPDAPAGTGS